MDSLPANWTYYYPNTAWSAGTKEIISVTFDREPLSHRAPESFAADPFVPAAPYADCAIVYRTAMIADPWLSTPNAGS